MALDTDPGFVVAFRRRADGLTYLFAPAGRHNGRAAWRRVDRDLGLDWTPETGWAIRDAEGAVLGRPWEVEREEQGAQPPFGVWVGRKDDKAYVYDCVRQDPIMLP